MTRVLTIDRGNSTLDCMLHDSAGTLRQRLAVDGGAELDAFLERARPEQAVGLTVVAGGLEIIAGALRERGVPLRVAGDDLPCPLRLCYDDPRTLGTDRWVGALAAYRAFGAALVIDCGTALTVNAVDATGSFLGGAIAPGFATMVFGLRARAPALPGPMPGPMPEIVRLPASSSRDAVSAGVVLGFCGLVERLAADLAAGSGLAGAVRVITGGEAELYLRHGRLAVQHVPDLVHRGLLCLIEASVSSC